MFNGILKRQKSSTLYVAKIQVFVNFLESKVSLAIFELSLSEVKIVIYNASETERGTHAMLLYTAGCAFSQSPVHVRFSITQDLCLVICLVVQARKLDTDRQEQ